MTGRHSCYLCDIEVQYLSVSLLPDVSHCLCPRGSSRAHTPAPGAPGGVLASLPPQHNTPCLTLPLAVLLVLVVVSPPHLILSLNNQKRRAEGACQSPQSRPPAVSRAPCYTPSRRGYGRGGAVEGRGKECKEWLRSARPRVVRALRDAKRCTVCAPRSWTITCSRCSR